jgi:hypothetical protein
LCYKKKFPRFLFHPQPELVSKKLNHIRKNSYD